MEPPVPSDHCHAPGNHMEAIMVTTTPDNFSAGDEDYQAHVRTYHAFVRGLRYAVATAIIILLLLAFFLL